MGRCKAPGCKPETPLKEWAALNGLAERPEEGVRAHSLRCVELIQKDRPEAPTEPRSGLSPVSDDTPAEVLDWLSSVPRLPQEDHDDDIPRV